ncbi:MAG: DUF1592 domain-containing protein [Abyssibacter sp.]|uniref:DUF1592 domain-containing protein n=1 Tax=Abyssibacter sp. TaxID=2320200 RepID=UPI003218E9C4
MMRVMVALLVGSVFLVACSGDYSGGDGATAPGAGAGGGSEDVPLNLAGRDQYLAQCASCHGGDGQGTPSGPTLVGCATCGSVEQLASRIGNTMPLADPVLCSGDCASDTADYVLAAFNTQFDDTAAKAVLAEILPADPVVTLRKATLNLAGRLPTDAEVHNVASGGEVELAQVLDVLMQEDAFYERLIEIYNDDLLQNKYLGGENAVNLLRASDFPQRRWYRDLGLDTEDSEQRALFDYLKAQTNDAVAQEALRLVEYIVRNQRPVTELLTADYMVANYYSARAYGAEHQQAWRQLPDPPFPEYPYDPDDYRPIRIANAEYGEIPHAGVMTSAMFLNRFPTTETNRNRHRSRMVHALFLDTDVLQLSGVRPGEAVDLDSATPTLDNPACSVCHTVVDPVAAVFQNWNSRGQYQPSRHNGGWHSDMEARGFNGEAMPLAGNVDRSVAWLGEVMVQDPRFARSVVKRLFRGLTGQSPLPVPAADVPDDAPERLAYQAQTVHFNGLRDALIAADFRIEPVIRGIVLGPYFRADGVRPDAGSGEEVHRYSGSERLLTPEMLHRKIQATLGLPWERWGYPRLTSRRSDSLAVLYGGIDSDNVIRRITEPNGLMASLQQRMAHEMACAVTARDFFHPRDVRRLFRFVERDDSLLDDSGAVDPVVRAHVEQTLQHLFWSLLGLRLDAADREIQRVLNLMIEVQSLGRADYDDRINYSCDLTRHPETGEDLPGEQKITHDATYMLRTWQAVLVYLLTDYRFVYE